MTFLMPSPILGAAPSFITTVQVMPALIKTPGGTCVMWTLTGMRCASRTQVNMGLMEQRSSGPPLLCVCPQPPGGRRLGPALVRAKNQHMAAFLPGQFRSRWLV